MRPVLKSRKAFGLPEELTSTRGSGIDQEFVEPAVSVAQCFDETVSRLRSHCS